MVGCGAISLIISLGRPHCDLAACCRLGNLDQTAVFNACWTRHLVALPGLSTPSAHRKRLDVVSGSLADVTCQLQCFRVQGADVAEMRCEERALAAVQRQPNARDLHVQVDAPLPTAQHCRGYMYACIRSSHHQAVNHAAQRGSQGVQHVAPRELPKITPSVPCVTYRSPRWFSYLDGSQSGSFWRLFNKRTNRWCV